jgi:hypothetical protein
MYSVDGENSVRELKAQAADAGSWDAKDGRVLLLELGGAAGSSVWLELDNVKFY